MLWRFWRAFLITRNTPFIFFQLFFLSVHSRPQRQRSFWSAPRIATSGQVQRHSGFEWLCKNIRLRPEPIRFVILDSEHAQSDVKSVNCVLPLLDLARGRDFWCWPKGARPLGTRMWTEVKPVISFVKFLKRCCDRAGYNYNMTWLMIIRLVLITRIERSPYIHKYFETMHNSLDFSVRKQISIESLTLMYRRTFVKKTSFF